MRYLLLLTILTTLLQSNTPYTKTSDSISKFIESKQFLTRESVFAIELRRMESELEDANKYATSISTAAQKREYLDRLRALQKKQSYILDLQKRDILLSIKNRDYNKFSFLMKKRDEELLDNDSFRSIILSFYKNNKKSSSISYLDEMIAKDKIDVQQDNGEDLIDKPSYYAWSNAIVATEDKRTQNYYQDRAKGEELHKEASLDRAARSVKQTTQNRTKSVTLLCIKSVPYCKDATEFLHKNNIEFEEFDIQLSDRGRELFMSHNADAVPLILIGSSVMVGFEPEMFTSLYGAK